MHIALMENISGGKSLVMSMCCHKLVASILLANGFSYMTILKGMKALSGMTWLMEKVFMLLSKV